MSRKRQETGRRGGEREEDISLVGSGVSVVLETLGSVAATARPGPPRRRACPDSNRPSGARPLRTGCMTPSRARPGPDRYPCCDRGTRRSRGRRRPPRSGNELRQIRQVLREQLDVDEQVAAVTARAAYKMRRLGNRYRRRDPADVPPLCCSLSYRLRGDADARLVPAHRADDRSVRAGPGQRALSVVLACPSYSHPCVPPLPGHPRCGSRPHRGRRADHPRVEARQTAPGPSAAP